MTLAQIKKIHLESRNNVSSVLVTSIRPGQMDQIREAIFQLEASIGRHALGGWTALISQDSRLLSFARYHNFIP
ncbi:hypothetical protein BK662_05160 [Pseudomonas frederiksbergensis]|uniref:Uncharacterized protein n=1 Tax=Pseudomonas frederiksbergensis TaxID=104087 RepID=A0A423I023_9PSED|nr:hypothetical protein BK662_05160 [Pseudomonas frederiksbergensis]